MSTDTQNPKSSPKLNPVEPSLGKALDTPDLSTSKVSVSERLDQTQNASFEEPKSTDSQSIEAPVGVSAGDSVSAPISDMEKKIRRAERFGMPVQLSEKEKRSSRAERFGTSSTVHGSDALKKSEELKRKARAERFGLPAQSAATDEEVKKKARLARFAPVSKNDTIEEDKKKARALRFSNPSSDSLPQVNGKGNIELKTAIVGKASEGV